MVPSMDLALFGGKQLTVSEMVKWEGPEGTALGGSRECWGLWKTGDTFLLRSAQLLPRGTAGPGLLDFLAFIGRTEIWTFV